MDKQNTPSAYDHSSTEEFYDYYAEESMSDKALQRLSSIRDLMLRVMQKQRGDTGPLEVLDIGCGAGTLSMLWAERGHHVRGLDVNEPLINLARERSQEAGYSIEFKVGTATALPWADESVDVCLVPELLEHVPEWEQCLNEFSRVLKPGGVLYLSTTNKLCPVQNEFDLPLYSWYPGFVKRYCEHLATTSRPQIAGHATYPAVNWFSFYSLRREMARRGFRTLDRFEVMDKDEKSAPAKVALTLINVLPGGRFVGQVLTPYSQIVSIKKTGD